MRQSIFIICLLLLGADKLPNKGPLQIFVYQRFALADASKAIPLVIEVVNQGQSDATVILDDGIMETFVVEPPSMKPATRQVKAARLRLLIDSGPEFLSKAITTITAGGHPSKQELRAIPAGERVFAKVHVPAGVAKSGSKVRMIYRIVAGEELVADSEFFTITYMP